MIADTVISPIAAPRIALVCSMLSSDPYGAGDDAVAVELAWRTWSFGFYEEHVPCGLRSCLGVRRLLDYAGDLFLSVRRC